MIGDPLCDGPTITHTPNSLSQTVVRARVFQLAVAEERGRGVGV